MSSNQGGYLQLQLYRHPSGAALNAGEAAERLKSAFPEVQFLPGDQLADQAAKVEKATAAERAANPASPYHRVLESLRRFSQTYGPAYAFRLPDDAPRNLTGRVRRYDITFHYDLPLDESLRARIVMFLQSFGVGWIEEYLPTSKDVVCLYDLKGGSTEPPAPAPRDSPTLETKTT